MLLEYSWFTMLSCFSCTAKWISYTYALSTLFNIFSPYRPLQSVLVCLFGLWWVLVATRRTFSCGMWDLAAWPGIRPGPPALGAWSLNPWTTREVPITEYWGESPVLYSRSLIVIYFIDSSVCMLIPVFQFIPPHPLTPHNLKFVFYIRDSISGRRCAVPSSYQRGNCTLLYRADAWIST